MTFEHKYSHSLHIEASAQRPPKLLGLWAMARQANWVIHPYRYSSNQINHSIIKLEKNVDCGVTMAQVVGQLSTDPKVGGLAPGSLDLWPHLEVYPEHPVL